MKFVQGIDYGPRKGTLGFVIHMAEGGDGTVLYLARRAGESLEHWKARVRGVSANFVILSTGEVVQMVAWDHASGSMNPQDRSDDTGFYQTKYIQAVLGPHYTDPNAWSLSVEITGYRSAGPTRPQVEALVELVAEARRRYPGMVGAYGHADQTDTKGCPGTSALMMEAWATIGHGKFQEEADVPGRSWTYVYDADGRIQTGDVMVNSPDGVTTPHWYLELATGKLVRATGIVGKLKPAVRGRLDEPITPALDTEERRQGFVMGDRAAFILATDCSWTPDPPRPVSYPVKVTVGGQVVDGNVTLP